MKTSFLLLMSFIFLSAGMPGKKLTEEWLPEGFNPSKGTLLIMSHPLGEKQTNRMEEYFQKEYPYAFEIVDIKDDETHLAAKYDDLTKYPYIVIWNFNLTYEAGGVHARGADLFGRFMDRKTKFIYPSPSKNFAYGQIGYRPFIKKLLKQFNP